MINISKTIFASIHFEEEDMHVPLTAVYRGRKITVGRLRLKRIEKNRIKINVNLINNT